MLDHTPQHPIEVPQSAVAGTLTTGELTGETMRRYGMVGERQHQPGFMPVEPWNVRYVHPAMATRAPMPSARRAAPRHPPMAAA
jgi:hypothetical protein